LSRIIKTNRRSGRTDGYIDVPTTGDQLTDARSVECIDDVFQSSDDSEFNKMSLPPRYRFRDLLLGDFAFTDDGQR
jgi:hypothetical protein